MDNQNQQGISSGAGLKFNVHIWNGGLWGYVGTVKAPNSETACDIVAARMGGHNQYQAYPHIDNFEPAAPTKKS